MAAGPIAERNQGDSLKYLPSYLLTIIICLHLPVSNIYIVIYSLIFVEHFGS